MSSISELRVDSIDVVSSLDSMSCRVCWAHFGAFLTLDSELDEGKKLLEFFNEYTLLQADINDQLPQILCQSCVDDLNLVGIFIKRARTADQQYRERIKNQTAPAAEKQYACQCQEDNSFKEIDNEDNDSIKIGPAFVSDMNFDDEIEVLFEEHESLSEGERNDLHQNEASGKDNVLLKCSRKVNRSPIDSVERKIFGIYACELCGKRFTSKQKLQQHDLVHMETKELKCSVCPKEFATIHDQRIHLKRHSADRIYVCEQCNKILGSRQGLHRHRKLHTGERPYICDICGRSFSQRSVLKTHQTLHVGKHNKCPHCPKMFSRPSQLIVHRRAHTGERPYKCNDCGNTYTQKSHLDRHVGTHLGLRFKCARCDKSYSKKSTLKSHIEQYHEVPLEYKCSECSKIFNKKKSFQYHVKTKHNSKADLLPDV